MIKTTAWSSNLFRIKLPSFPNLSRWICRPRRGIFLLLLVVLASLLRTAVVTYTSDDAYISFTYARNFARGEGLRFNPEEQVYGFTNPIWTILISLPFGLLSQNQAVLAIKLLALGFSIATILLLYYVTLKETQHNEAIARLFALLWAIEPWDVAEAMNGLETPLLCFTLLAVFHLARQKKWTWVGWGMGVAILTRPESFLLFVLMFAWLVVSKKQSGRWLFGYVAAFTTVILPWYAYAYLTYHSLLPNSFFEKANLGLTSARHLLTQLAFAGTNYALPYVAIAITFWQTRCRKRTGCDLAIPFLAWSVIITTYYVLIPSFIRYFVAPSLLSLVCWAQPLQALFERTSNQEARKGELLSRLLVILALGFLLIRGGLGSAANLYFYNLKAQGFHDLHVYTAQWIAQNTPSDAVVAAHDVGALGFYANRLILDTTGLVSNDQKGFHGSPQKWLAARQPDYLFVCLNWVGSFPSTLDCELDPVLTRQGHISFRTPEATFVLYRCYW